MYVPQCGVMAGDSFDILTAEQRAPGEDRHATCCVRLDGAGLPPRRGTGRSGGRGAGDAHHRRAGRLCAVRERPGRRGDRGEEDRHDAHRGRMADPQVPDELPARTARVPRRRCVAVRLRVNRCRHSVFLRIGPGSGISTGVHVPSARDVRPLAGGIRSPRGPRASRELGHIEGRLPATT